MTLHVYDFDPAEFLVDEAAIEAFVEEAIESGDPEEIEEAKAVAARARARLAKVA